MTEEESFRFLVAFLYQRSGRTSLSENELANAASLDLKWFAPKAARGLVAGMVRAGWLVRDEDGELLPSFDVKTVQVPMGFRPPADLPNEVPPPGSYEAGAPEGAAMADGRMDTGPSGVREGPPSPAVSPSDRPEPAAADDDEPETLLGRILQAMAATTGEEAPVWVARMDAVVQRTDDGVTPEVALLLAAAKEGHDVAPWLTEARQRITTRSQPSPDTGAAGSP